ncbi:hypothetical protein Pelo_1621 [Pelomyxa schiedti]|nr:hypothetical protein Pelo_1621 [Pelomyxa schiedti]
MVRTRNLWYAVFVAAWALVCYCGCAWSEDVPEPPIFPAQYNATLVITTAGGTVYNGTLWSDYFKGKKRMDTVYPDKLYTQIIRLDQLPWYQYIIQEFYDGTVKCSKSMLASNPIDYPEMILYGTYGGTYTINGVEADKWTGVKNGVGYNMDYYDQPDDAIAEYPNSPVRMYYIGGATWDLYDVVQLPQPDPVFEIPSFC